MNKFHLSSEFIASYASRTPPFGFNGLGALVYNRTYSRLKDDGAYERWHETCERVVNGCYNLQAQLPFTHGQYFDLEKAQGSAQQMYDRMFNMKFLPPGRGLWAMGSPMTEERRLFASLFNCAFVSTKQLNGPQPTAPFVFLMDMSMLGVGVGFDVLGAGTILIQQPLEQVVETFHIPDSREGWVLALEKVLGSYFFPQQQRVEFNFDLIRPAGLPIKGFGGLSSGPQPLQDLLASIPLMFKDRVNTPITITDIVDIMNRIGKCVVAGNVRRTAEIAFGPAEDEYLDLKNYHVNPHRTPFSWTSNNSVFAQVGMDYNAIADRIRINGEPGLAWLENMQAYSRMDARPDWIDKKAQGGNPCLEQTLESYELCCLVETFPTHHDTLDDFLATLKYAYLYAKTVSLCMTHWTESNKVMARNRRIGCSVSGIADWNNDLDTLRTWLRIGYSTIQSYDRIYSEWFQINRSIKTTSVKPSGTVSLLAGVSPGMHWPEARYYYRRVRLAANSPFVLPLQIAGYHVEPDVREPETTVIVRFPIKTPDHVRTGRDITMWEQLSMAAFLQQYWADNQVSCTVTFDPVTEGPQIASALNYFQFKLKGISFLPRCELGSYPQMPYEEISQDTFQREINDMSLKPTLLIRTRSEARDTVIDSFCDGETCQGPFTNIPRT